MKKFIFVIMAVILSNYASAQSLKDMFNKDNLKNTIGDIVSDITNQEINVEGSWEFEESAIEFESDNLLQKAGGALAANQLKEKMDELLEKVGIKKGSLEYTFNADKSFTSKLGNIPSRGTYEIDNENKSMTMKYIGGLMTTECKVKYSNDRLTLLFKADKLIDIVSSIAGAANVSSLNTISSLLESYDGCNVGFSLSKKQ